MLQIGSVLERKYKILNMIGQGGMSSVYLALNERANKTWAVKEIRKEGVVNDAASLAALVAETDILKRLHHPNLPSISDILDYEDSIVIVMDYIEGKDLDKKLKTEGAQPPDKVLNWAKQLCDVMGYLHSQEPPIIYRDMKPANLMLKPNGIDLCVIDFGTAREYKYKTKAEDTMTLGTRGYAAPEQYGGKGETDARTDIYNMGATLYHLLTGIGPIDPPFYEMRLLREIDPAYEDSGWEYILRKCCQNNPEDRYQTCEELRYDLDNIENLTKKALTTRKRKMGAFLASVGLCALGGLGMLGFWLAGNGAQSETYGYYLDLAKEEASISQAQPYYRKAMEIAPGQADAYQTLISAVAKDGRLDNEEIAATTSLLKERYSGSRSNQQYLQAGDPEAYDDLMYQLGILYFFMHDNSVNDMETAAKYFSEVLESRNLSGPERELANILYTIGESYGQLNSPNPLNDFTYATYWSYLCEMVEGNVPEKVGTPFFAVALYNQMAYQIFENYKSFNSYGVTQQEMSSQLDIVEEGLRSISSANNPTLQSSVDSALTTASGARRAVAAYFDKRG